METLVAVAQHRHQYFTRSKSHVSDRCVSSPSGSFRGINCRTFQSGAGILPSPPRSFASIPSPKSPCFYSESPKQRRRSKPVAVNSPMLSPNKTDVNDDISCPELWAGPAYSNSPPPSSLPMPKFSLRQKRSISLELPLPKPEVSAGPIPNSAPSSPTRDFADDFVLNAATATENLRRILHLDVADD
ncbi:hypothetical protein ACMD2_03132 [Ananas comosus]|uniref:Uncharacterized protein n=1 Tax=Ananas comosus TaxID=4615 RepID=A0A199VET3_ANACO|nr:hypothetical protein ACMD2_03132 [Ananas comosus]